MWKYFLISFILSGICRAEKRDFVVKMTRFEVNSASKPDWADKGTLRVTQKARNEYVVSGIFYLFKNIGNEVLAILTINSVSPSGNVIPVYTKQGALCEYLANENMMYPSLVAKSDLPPQDTCPFPKGNYTVKDYVIEEDQLPEKVPLGKFVGTTLLQFEQETILGFDFEFTVSKA